MEDMVEKVKWIKVLARKVDVQKAEQFVKGTSLRFAKIFGTKTIKHQMYYFDGNTTHMFYDEKEFNEFQKSLMERVYEERFIMDNLNKFILYFEKVLTEGEKLSKKQGKLIEIFDEWNELWARNYPYGWFFFYIPFLDELVENGLRDEFPDEYMEMIEIVSKPPRLTPITSQEVDIMKFSIGQVKIKELVDNYSWMSVYNFEDKPRTEEYYIEEAKKFKGIDVENKIKEIEIGIKDNERNFNSLIKKIKNGTLKAQVLLLHNSGYIRDMREEVRDRLTLLESDFYERLGKAIGLSLREVVYLTTDEIKEALKTGKSFKKEANERIKNYVLVGYNENVKITDEIDVEKILNRSGNDAKGRVAFSFGKVIGTARLVLNNSEINKVKEGDILIASMTKPDYMSAIKKALAIVTDEGGVTCHAAIVSRELKKPCVIGTKNATLIFKDGDKIEVDSVNGKVRKI
jgi:phosphohistidine swiveling domain-containing protein